MLTNHAAEVARGDRFEFGRNWSEFLKNIDDARIEAAVASLQSHLGEDRLDGRTFLDAGSGSGLFSLAARMLGAQVHSFDYDPRSVACTEELKRRYRPLDDGWKIELGSVLDRSYMDSLGRFDITYSWGVLHHTGAMWQGSTMSARPSRSAVDCSSRSTTTRAARAAAG
jgi:2-polyprenyl-3-methyl-5-hydroxy-6-metoxy-1,4-benzoquinol methylase